MKKTIIALMALAGLSMASDEFIGLTFNNTGTGSGTSSMLGFTFTLKANSSDYTVTNTMEIEFPEVLTLTEVSFDKVFVFNKSNTYGSGITSKDVYLYITDTEGTIFGISEATSVSANTNANTTGGPVTFTLDCDNLKTGNEYQAWFMGSDSSYSTSDTGVQTISFTGASTVELRSVSALVSTSGDLKLLTATNATTNNYTFANMSIKTVPEPTTATLSLLALAGLAVRRRRK